MNARERLKDIVENGNFGPNAIDFAEAIVDMVKEDIKTTEYANAFAKGMLAEPPLIQGYTAEQWQEIIDGGYLCEFSGSGNEELGFLEKIKSGAYPFVMKESGSWSECRLCSSKGVMRPIWVEPVDRKVCCHFFNVDGSHLGTAYPWKDYARLAEHGLASATKYIEI